MPESWYRSWGAYRSQLPKEEERIRKTFISCFRSRESPCYLSPKLKRSHISPLKEFNPVALPPGSKSILDFQIAEGPDGGTWGVSVLFVRGVQPGPVLLVNGGTHGDEYEGPAAVQELFQELSPAEIQGTWLGVPVLNEPAMSISERCGKFDHQDLARTFPGKPDGTVTEQIAFRFGHYLLKTCELLYRSP